MKKIILTVMICCMFLGCTSPTKNDDEPETIANIDQQHSFDILYFGAIW